MPWKETGRVDERRKWLIEVLSGQSTFAEACRRFGVSRKTGYKWRARWLAETTLADASRARITQAHRVPDVVVQWLLDGRRRRPHEGPRLLLQRLQRQQPDVAWPSASTAGEILRRHGLVEPRKLRRRVHRDEAPLASMDAPNAVWSADFKGWFRTRNDHRKCEPLTVTDGYSRYLLCCRALRRNDGDAVREALEEAFTEHGLPRVLRTDNGPPFATSAPAGLSRLSIWLIQIGVRPERIEPGRPQQNGRHERFHLTLKQATASPPARTLREQQARFDAFRFDYNVERPHSALGGSAPASVYERSDRELGPPRAPTYDDDHVELEVRRVKRAGTIKWRGRELFLSQTFSGIDVALEQLPDERWRVRFDDVVLGHVVASTFSPVASRGNRVSPMCPV